MDNMANLAEVRRERGIFLAGSCLLVIGLPLGMWGLARELLMSGSALARYWEPVGYPVAAAVMHGSAVYFVWRLSSFLREPRCRTGLWSVLAFVVVPFYLIPAVALLVKAQRSEKKLVDAKIEVINTELHGFLLTEPTESQIIEWVRQRGFHLIEPDPYAFQFNAELGFRDSAAGPPPFCYDFRSPELRRILRVGRGPEDRTLPGQAIGDIQHAVPDSLRETYAHHKRAEELERRGEFDAAIEEFRIAIETSPEAASSQYALGLLLARLGRYEEAVPGFEAACRARPDWGEARTNLGCALHDLGRWHQAEAELREAIAVAPLHANAHFNLAIVLGKLERFPEAMEAVLRALALDPANAKARLYLENLNAAMGGGRR